MARAVRIGVIVELRQREDGAWHVWICADLAAGQQAWVVTAAYPTERAALEEFAQALYALSTPVSA